MVVQKDGLERARRQVVVLDTGAKHQLAQFEGVRGRVDPVLAPQTLRFARLHSADAAQLDQDSKLRRDLWTYK